MNLLLSCRPSFVTYKNAGIIEKLRPVILSQPCKQLYSTSKGHRPNTIDKYLLVWMKKYPSVKEVPDFVRPDMMERVRNKSRIKITIYMMIVTGIVCVFMIFSGKRAAKRGESIRKMNQDWHKEQNEKK
ncbi:UPF0389 protein CG9231 [Parasteatoda tepidariorum]|uniref:UPF0389 protein CG9231 n=1 Tax=Parasteatoda tepidariorum TaxID=114398 RepID=UPI00077FB440|nr:UPF0389 protein CG9231 [Parasteatoda tepidariorum]